MLNTKDALRVYLNESNYKKTLNKNELKVYKKLRRERKVEVVLAWLNDEPVNLLDKERVESINKGTLTQELTNTKSIKNIDELIKQNDKVISQNEQIIQLLKKLIDK